MTREEEQLVKQTFDEACKALGYIPTPPHPAKILLGGQVLSSGSAQLYAQTRRGLFVPHTGEIPDIPDGQASLTLLDTQQTIALERIERCAKGLSLHYHLHFQEQMA